jgi:hypothetical protein
MCGSRFVSFLLILAISITVWTGCGESPSPPADAGTVIEDASELPGANQPYPMERLDKEKSPAESEESEESEKSEESEAKPAENRID